MTISDEILIGKAKQDPLTDTADHAQVLFSQLGKVCSGYPHEAVQVAASNLLLNVLRQQLPTWQKAEVAFDELFGKMKSVLKNHYDGSTGNRRSVFPFNQIIEVPRMDFSKGAKFN